MKTHHRSGQGTTFDVWRPNASLPSSTNRPLINRRLKPQSDPMVVRKATKERTQIKEQRHLYSPFEKAPASSELLDELTVDQKTKHEMVVMPPAASKHHLATHKVPIVAMAFIVLVILVVVTFFA